MQDADRPKPDRGPSAAEIDLEPVRAEMERLGQVTSGVIHDFNNLLTIVLGCVEHACLQLPPDAPALVDLEEVKLAVRQGSQLVARLLHANRPRTPAIVNVNAVLRGAQSLITRAIGPKVALQVEEAPDLWPVRAHPAEIWQLLINLATNARDAMPQGGRLVLRTRNRVQVAPAATNTRRIAAGDYVVIEVTDNGCGMDAATATQVFTPFFTTKGTGGTGLGLSTAARIVDECGGGIVVTSQLRVGTTFEVLLPRAT